MSAVSEEKKSGVDQALYQAARSWLSRTNSSLAVERWIAFHQSPVALMHPERWGSSGPNWQSFILQSSYASEYVDDYYRHVWNWEVGPWTDLKDPLMQLTISDQGFLSRLTAFIGAFLAAEEIRKVVDRKTVQTLRDGLGDGPLYFARTQAMHLNIAIPEKCRLQAWNPSHAVTITINAGWVLLACAAGLLPAKEWRQFLRRIPQAVEEAWNEFQFSTDDFRSSWQCIQGLLEFLEKQE